MSVSASDLQALVSTIVQPMMTQMNNQNAQLASQIAQLVSDMKQTGEKKGRIDHRSIGGPPEWDSGKEESFQEWHIKLEAWLMNQDGRALKWLGAARVANEAMTTESLDLNDFDDEHIREDCKKFNTMLFNILITKLKGEAFNIVSSVKDGCGFEGWRLLMKRYEPRTPATKRALLKTIFNMKAAKKVEEIEKNLLKLEDIYARYEIMADSKLPEDIKTVIMIELCTPELKEHLEFNSKDVGYKETREAVMAYVERKRRDPYTAMEIGNQETYNHQHEYCDDWSFAEHYDADAQEQEVNYWGFKGWKGNGGAGPKGKGKGPAKGGGKD